MIARDSVYDGSRDNPLNLEVIRIFQIFTLCTCIILSSGASQKKNHKNKIKTTFGSPLLPIKIPHKTPTLTNLSGGGPDPPPLWIRAC